MLGRIHAHLGLGSVSGRVVFCCVCNFLRSPRCHAVFRTSLGGDLPHVPVVRSISTFHSFCRTNGTLTGLRLGCRYITTCSNLRVISACCKGGRCRRCTIGPGVGFPGGSRGSAVVCGSCVAVEGVPTRTCSCIMGNGSTVR